MKTKKLVSLLAACALLVTVLAVLPASAATNYFTHENVGFEAGNTTGWNESNATGAGWTVANTDEDAYTGTHSLKVSISEELGSAATIQYSGARTAMAAGTEYVLSIMVKSKDTSSSTGGGGVQLYAKNADTQYGETVILTDGWQKITLAFTPTAMTVDTIVFYIRLRDHTKGTYYFDDIALHTKAELDAEAAAEAAARFSFVTEYAPTYSMDTDTDVQSFTNGSYEVVTDKKMEGTGSMKVTCDASKTESILYMKNRPTLTAGTTYEASVWVNIPAEETNVTKIRMFVAEKSGTTYAYHANDWYTITTTNGQWKRLSAVFTASYSLALNSMRLDVETIKASEAGQTATVYWDAFTLVEKAAQNPVLQILDANACDMLAPTGGAFTVKYDMHTANAENAGKALIAAIYEETDGVKRLVEVHLGAFTAESTEAALAFTGIVSPTNANSLKVMLWDSTATLVGLKQATFAFN